jgi:hypothetical protein
MLTRAVFDVSASHVWSDLNAYDDNKKIDIAAIETARRG